MKQNATEESVTPSSVAPACHAALNIEGQHYPCDWQPLDDVGQHPGWAHTSRDAKAVWQ